ncbi:MAG: SEC-C metal-binding domain-containing protein [Nakamurella sp.]
MTTQALLSALADSGFDGVDRWDIEELLDAGDIPHVVQSDEDDESVFYALDILLQGRIFTHRLTGNEITEHAIDVTVDLDVLLMLTEAAPFDQLEDGSPAESSFIERDDGPAEILVVPESTLSAFRDGDLIGLGAVPGGLRITAVQKVSAVPDGVKDQVALLIGPDGKAHPMMLDGFVERLCLANPELFTEPLAPLSDLLAEWGLTSWGAYVGPAGFDFDNWSAGTDLADLAQAFDLTEDQASTVRAMTQQFHQATQLLETLDIDDPAFDPDQPIKVGQAGQAPPELADPAVAEAFYWETVGAGADAARVMVALADSWNTGGSMRIRPALAWLQGKSHERLGEAAEAEMSFERSLTLDPFFGCSLVDLARYAADRGDASRAIALLDRAGFTAEDPLLGGLLPYQPAARPDVGRNDQCWCGSGRKYKKCHLGKIELSAAQHANWLRQKVVLFAHEPPQVALLLQMATIRTAHQDTEPANAVDDPVVLDVALFEGEVLASFTRIRGDLLPAQERSLLEQWSMTERSVFEVTAVRAGRGVTLLDLRRGGHYELTDESEGAPLSRSMQQGELLLTRLLQVGDSVATFGLREPVAPGDLDNAMELFNVDDDEFGGPIAWIAALSARLIPGRN